MRLVHRVVEEPHSCVYLPSEAAALDVRLMLDVTPIELDALLSRGWRRFGPCYFRPMCAACGECVTLRICVNDFVPSRSQKRAARLASQLRRVVSQPHVDRERLELYEHWHGARQDTRGWDESRMDAERYALDFAFPHPCAREVTYRDDANGGRLVAVGLFDETPTAFSAAYFFYDHEWRGSLGVANVVHLVADARARGLEHVYLGYRVMGCESLKYKSNYHPHELLHGRPALDEDPTWERTGNE